ncbi:MAG: YtxH domain-containing protein [Gemmatimonadaceae bacterium]
MSRAPFDDDERYVIIERQQTNGGVPTFLIGLAIGAVAALLLAPQSGEETRDDIKRRARGVRHAAKSAVTRAATNVTDTVTDTFDDARRKVEERIESVRDEIDLKKRQVHLAMDAGRSAAREARVELEGRIAETKAAYDAGATVAKTARSARAARVAEIAEHADES